jgi:hypothetical protein
MTYTTTSPGLSYSFLTDKNYTQTAQLRESDVRLHEGGVSFTATLGGSLDSARLVVNDGSFVAPSRTNTFDGLETYGSIFGPTVWSEVFSASASEAVSFEWKASGSGDDYEIYAFLVEVACSSNANDFGQVNPLETHNVLVHSRGNASSTNGGQTISYFTAKGVVGSDGCYRFRMTGGTYDATGGFLVGADFEVRNFLVGANQVITAQPMSDAVRSGVSQSFQVTAQSNAPGATLTYRGVSPSSRCTVDSSGQVEVIALQTGYCLIAIDSGAVSGYSAAQTTFVGFTILNAATAPIFNEGAEPTGQATICSTLTVSEGSWSDGGSAITSTTYQWLKDANPIAGATSSSYTVDASDVGSAISFSITKTNNIGSRTGVSSAVVIEDARLTGLSLGGSSGLSPSFTGCTTTYTTTTVNDSVTVTATMNSAADSVAVSGSSVVSAQTSSPIQLSPGANVIPIVVTAGSFSLTYNVTVTYAAPPTVQALAPTFTDGQNATLSATIDANGFDTSTISFTITPTGGTSGTPVQGALTPSQVTGNTATSVEQSVTGLVSGGYYTFQVSVTNANGTSTDSISFQTPDAPSVQTGASSNVSATSASVSWEINTFNKTTSATVSYSVNSDMTNATEISLGELAPALSASSGAASLTGLVAGTTYYYNFSALNDAGSNTGVVRSFTTFGAPIVSVLPGEGGDRTALLRATVNAAGLTTTAVRFYYSTDNFATSVSVVATPANVSGGTDTNVQVRLTNIDADTYSYKVEAVNSAGSTLSSGFETVVVFDSPPTATLSAPATVGIGSPITIIIRFSESVGTSFASSDLALTVTSGSIQRTVGAALDLGSNVYSVTLTNVSGTGTLAIGLPAGRVTEAQFPAGGSAQVNLAATSITVIVGATPPDVSYTSNTLTLTVGQAMTTLTPVNSGGASTSWSPSIALPAGLAIDNSTGVISGTPVAIQSATAYVITAENSGGTDTFTITITIVYQVPGISFQSTEYTLVVGNPFNETPANSGGPISTWTIVGSLPEGLSFNSSTGGISGTPTAPAERISITISGQNGTGTSEVTIGIRVLAYVYWNGPHVQQIVPTVLITSGGETVTLYGLRLNRIESVEIEGISITITVTSNKQVSFVTPSMSPGVKNLKLHGSRVGRHEVINAVMVVEPPRVQEPATQSPEVPTESPEVPTESPEVPTESPEVATSSPEVPSESPEVPTESPEVPTESPEVGDGDGTEDPVLSLEKRVLSGFAPGSAVLTQAMRDRLVNIVSDLGTLVAFSCVGYTQGPSVLDVDIALSLARAQVVCDELRLLFPDAEVRQIAGRQDDPVGTPIRRTEIYFLIAE